MSKFLKIPLVIIVALITLNCSSDDDDGDDFVGTTIDAEFTIQNDEVVNFFLGDFGESGTAMITVNPENFSVNRLIGSNYTYEPSDGFVGTDFVEIFNSVVNVNIATGNTESRFFRTRITITVME